MPKQTTFREARAIRALLVNGLSPRAALLAQGFSVWHAEHPESILSAEQLEKVEKVRALAVESALHEGFLDAKEQLAELIRQLARLMNQSDRLHAMLGHDIADLYSEGGALKAVSEWPEVWRTQLVTEIESKEVFEYSTDGQTAGESKTWDKAGELKKLKRESALSIEKQITQVERQISECLEAIAQHKIVDAKAAQKGSLDLNITVSVDEQRRMLAAQKRRSRVIPAEATPSEPSDL